MGSIGLSMIVRDEPADRLAMLVEYVKPVVSQVVIADTGSAVDETELYKTWGVDAFKFDWVDDFAAARNSTLDHFDVGIDWILHLDADELPSWTMVEHLRWIKDHAPKKVKGYQFWTQNFWGGIVGGEAPYHWHCRLFRRGHGRWYKKVHEQVEIDGLREEQAHSKGWLVHAAKEAYLIHSKPQETMDRANEVYSRIGEGPRQ